jgi:hypothetical protein
MMRFYAFRALALAGEDLYESFWERMWAPWRGMLKDIFDDPAATG